MESPFMRAPVEVRMMIYEYLFDDGGNERLLIQSAGAGKAPQTAKEGGPSRRTRYYVLDRSMHRRCYETTYCLRTPGVRFCAALMRASRTVHEETAYVVYGRHAFDFGSDIEAVGPFLADLTAPSRRQVREIALYKRGPMPLYNENDRSEWRAVCRSLRERAPALRKLRLVVQAGRPAAPWDGPPEFTAAEFKLLSDIKHESLDWVSELARVRGIEELEIVPDVHHCPPPVSTSMIVFAAFSASIERGLAEFLRNQLRL